MRQCHILKYLVKTYSPQRNIFENVKVWFCSCGTVGRDPAFDIRRSKSDGMSSNPADTNFFLTQVLYEKTNTNKNSPRLTHFEKNDILQFTSIY